MPYSLRPRLFSKMSNYKTPKNTMNHEIENCDDCVIPAIDTEGIESLGAISLEEDNVVTEGKNLFSNMENENFSWVKSYKERNEKPNTVKNEISNSSRLAFIAGDEIKKLVGNKTNDDTIFTPGPDIEEFIEAFEAYTSRHNLVSDLDKITALKMSAHPSMGDARIVLSSILDSQINEDNITYKEVISYLRRAYVTCHSVNFFRASKHFLELCSPQKSEKNDFVCLRNIEIAAKQLIQGFKKRNAHKKNNKNSEDNLMEFLLLVGFSMWGGEKLSKKIINFEANLLPREILLRVQEEKRQEKLKSQQNNVLFIRNSGQNVKRNLMSPQQFQSKSEKNRNTNIVCRKCAGSHPTSECKTTIELFCAKCYKFGHVRSVCGNNSQLFRQPQQKRPHFNYK